MSIQMHNKTPNEMESVCIKYVLLSQRCRNNTKLQTVHIEATAFSSYIYRISISKQSRLKKTKTLKKTVTKTEIANMSQTCVLASA